MPEHPDAAWSGSPGEDNLGAGSRLSVDYQRLRDSMDWSARQMAPFRANYVEAVNLYAGNRYGESLLDKSPLNFFRLAVDIWLRQLVSQSPRSLVVARSPALQSQAYELELALNHTLQQIDLGESLSEVVRSALFLQGIMKVGIAPVSPDDGGGYRTSSGNVYADAVLPEDWLHDMNARRPSEWEWCGNRYRLPYDMVKSNPDFDKDVRARIAPDQVREGDEGFGGEQARTNDLSAGDGIADTELRQHVEIWDLWIPGDRLLVTLPAQQGLAPLQVREWEGPSRGPYHLLGFGRVPGNVMAAAPAQYLYDLQCLITRLFNQLARQAIRQKTITVVDGQAQSDGTGQRIKDSADGDILVTNHIDGVKEMKYGQLDPANMNFTVWLKEVFSYLGGNLDAMGGLRSQADTLGQEQILQQSSSEMLRDMQSKVVTFTNNVMKDVAWYLYTDPTLELPLSKTIDGYGQLPFTWGPARREADFFSYNFDLAPYSLAHKSPQQRLAALMQISQQLLIPLAPQMGAWGMQFNLPKLVELMAKYGDLPELKELVLTSTATPEDAILGPSQQTPGRRPLQSPVTQRNYVRENRNPDAGISSPTDIMKAFGSAIQEG